MDPAQFRDRVADAKRTELDRIGSGKLLIALTEADLTDDAVLAAAADRYHAAGELLAAWADDEADADAASTFADLAERAADGYERVAAARDGHDPGPPGPVYEHLRDLSGTVDRAAGLVGHGLLADRVTLQFVSYFVNEADEARADLFRERRTDAADAADAAAGLVADRCAPSAVDDAADVASAVVDVAYREYADSLRDLGMDPKPIC
ncbi:rubrerythrin family protein [Halomicrobium salinisoli]|uniref:rubrerythrin family protein n=1 Tax=Halomicrobium salinisoli TaxID=2878391 RepID=UPI001CEFF291|nr:rubrerythrin family protein [Halomicrobium salinisoli]